MAIRIEKLTRWQSSRSIARILRVSGMGLPVLLMAASVSVPGLVARADEPAELSAQVTDTAAGEQDPFDLIIEELMATLADEMAEIRRTRDRAERQRLMEVHRTNMREALILMREIGGEQMATIMASHMEAQDKVPQEPNKRVHRHKQPPVFDTSGTSKESSRLTDLELRLDMMQIMLESLVDQYAEP